MIKSCRLPENIIILFYWTALSGSAFRFLCCYLVVRVEMISSAVEPATMK